MTVQAPYVCGIVRLLVLITALWPGTTTAKPSTSAATPSGEAACYRAQSGVSAEQRERWIWTELCAGRVADLDVFERVISRNTVGGNSRVVSPAFVHAALFDERFHALLPRQGVRIKGAVFRDHLDLQHGTLKSPLWIEHSLFKAGADLSGLRAERLVALHGSRFLGPLRLTFARLEGSLDLSGGDFGMVRLAGTKIDGQLTATDARFRDELNLFAVRIGNSAWLDRSLFCGRVYAQSAEIAGHLSLGSATLGGLDLEGARVSGNLNLDPSAAVSFTKDAPPSRLGACGSTVPNEVISAPLRRVGGVRDRPEFRRRLVTGFAAWRTSAELSLRAARVDALAGSRDLVDWPGRIDFEGFTYTQFARLNNVAGLREATVSDLHSWLQLQEHPSRQPYEQAAKVLRDAGHAFAARELLYHGRAWEHSRAAWWQWLWDLPPWLLVGYGYRAWYAGIWAVGLTLFGAYVFRGTHEARLAGMPYGFGYSFDTLLPLVKLRQRHFEIDLKGGQRYYFYVHRLMGYALATFLAGVVTGFIK